MTGLVGDIAAGSLTGALTVTTGDAADDNIAITTGSAATSSHRHGAGDTVTVDAAALANNTMLTLAGSAAEVVDRADRQHHRQFADRRAHRDHRGCHQQHHRHHHRLGGDLDHRRSSARDTVTVAASALARTRLLTLSGLGRRDRVTGLVWATSTPAR